MSKETKTPYQISSAKFLFESLPEWLRGNLTDTQRYTLLWIIAGVVCGLVAVVFHVLIDALFALIWKTAKSLNNEVGFIAVMLLSPTLGGLFSGLVIKYFAPSAAGSGIPQTKAAYYNNFGVLSLREAMWRFIIGTVSVGSGMSLGREGPTVHICAAIASKFGQWFGLAKKRVQAMVPVGMGAGIAAAFNTPLAAMFFVFEELLDNFSSKSLFGILVAVVIAATVERSILGEHPALDIALPAFTTDPWMIISVPLGIAAAFFGHWFVELLLKARAYFRSRQEVARWLQPAVGGLAVGIIGLSIYYATGKENRGIFAIGYNDLESTLNGHITVLGVLLLLFLGKAAATIVAYSSGGSGGLFAPSLFIGAMLGGIIGYIGQPLFHYGNETIGAIALLGMGAFFAAVIRSPMTSIMIIFEMTHNYTLILPLMVGNILAWLISQRLRAVSLYDALLLQDKISLKKFASYQGEQDWRNLPISTIMTFDCIAVDGNMTAADNLKALGERKKHAYPVISQNRELIGVITHHELVEDMRDKPDLLTRDLIAGQKLVSLMPDVSIRQAANTLVLNDYEQAPVVSQEDSKRLLGIVTLHDIARQQNAISDSMERE